MGERPVTVRTLDPPLHEFLPHSAKEQAEVAAQLGITPEAVKAKVDDLYEANLTQTTCGVSRDDAGKSLPLYLARDICRVAHPFATLDQDGVGQLVEMGTRRGRSTSPDLKVGICGKHCGDPALVEFCHRVGMNDETS